MNAIVFDLEVRRGPDELPGGWNDKDKMGVSCVGLFDLESRRYRFYWGEDAEDMADLGQRIERARFVVGFNHVGFDYPVLRGAGVNIGDRPEREVDLLGILWQAIDTCGQRVQKKGNGLDALCHANGLPAKSGNGAQAPAWFQQGRLGRLFTYQRDDVDLTWRLLCKVAREGSIILACGTRIEFPLPEPFASEFCQYLGLVKEVPA